LIIGVIDDTPFQTIEQNLNVGRGRLRGMPARLSS
jgi:hypothetical protein